MPQSFTLIIRTNVSHALPVVVGDVGFEVPASGSSVTINEETMILRCAESDDLYDLLTDDLYGAGSSTLILNDGTSDVAQSIASSFLDGLTSPGTTIYGLVRSGGQVPFSAQVAGVGPTLPAHLATKQYVDDQVSGGGLTQASHEIQDTLVHSIAESYFLEVSRTDGKIDRVTYWADSGKTVKIRESIVTRVDRKIAQVVTTQYDALGVAISGQTLSEVVTRAGGKISSVTATES